MRSTKFEFAITSDLKKYGVTEDGEDYIGEEYFLLARDEAGNQFAHRESFDGCQVHDEEEGLFFMDTRAEAKESADKLLAEVRAANPVALDPDNWRRVLPAYGSKAHNEAELCEWEREREGYGMGC